MDTEESSEHVEPDKYDIEASKAKPKPHHYKNLFLEIGSEEEEEIHELPPQESTRVRRTKQVFKVILPIALLLGFNILYHLSLEKCPLDLHENPVYCIDYFKTNITKWTIITMFSAL